MPNYWVLKTEPTAYSFGQLERDKSTVWDGVRNNLALKHIRNMRRGDRALIYHSGKEKAAVGIAQITSNPYADPEKSDPKMVVVDIKAAERLGRPVTLADIKGDSAFSDLALVRMPRLSVSPVKKRQWDRILKMAERSD